MLEFLLSLINLVKRLFPEEKKMLLQTDPRLNKDIQEVGCFFRCATGMVELVTKKVYSAKELNDIWDLALKQFWIVDRNLVKPVELMNYCFNEKKKARNTMVSNSDGTTWPEELNQPYDWIFQTNKTNSGVHYRLFNYDGQLTFDPMPGLKLGPWVQRSYYLIY